MIRTFLCLVLATLAFSLHAAQTEYIFLVTADGLRHQEVFTGVDPAILNGGKTNSGIERLEPLRKKYWADSPKERREKLMPFLWTELLKEGVLYGNRELGSEVIVRNPHHFSYPGYAEILNGGPVSQIDSNDSNFSPRETVLEFLRRKYNLKQTEVAAFGSWEVFNWITMHTENAIYCNAGHEAIEPTSLSQRRGRGDESFFPSIALGKINESAQAATFKPSKEMQRWSALQFEMLSPWDSVRHDAVTLNLALEYLAQEKPKIMYLALGETDDWAHDRRYDRYADYANYFDFALRRLWTTLQSSRKYRGKSTLIVTTDHGRGRTPRDWTSHGKDVPGANEAWLAIFGPDIQKIGEAKSAPQQSLSNIAATILQLLQINPHEYDRNISSPVAAVLNPK
ncbi:MAG TPA: sulfatase-like hydrolase/transferase [Verrucomicrobiae bacterium]